MFGRYETNATLSGFAEIDRLDMRKHRQNTDAIRVRQARLPCVFTGARTHTEALCVGATPELSSLVVSADFALLWVPACFHRVLA